MSLPQLTTDLNIIQALDDEPNDVGGLSSAQLKAKFDEAVGYIKTYLNDTLLPYLESVSGAGDIGITTVSGIQAATNVQEALEALELNIEGITQGAVADNSITNAKLTANAVDTANIVDDAVTSDKIDDGAVLSSHIASGAVGSTALASSAVGTSNIADGAVTADKLASSSVSGAKLADGAVTQNKLATSAIVADNIASNAVTSSKIKNSNVTTAKIADNAVTTVKIKDANVTTAKLADNAVTNDKLAVGAAVTNIGYTPQSKHLTATASLTTTGWSSKKKTVSVTGVTASNTVIVSPAPSSFVHWGDCGIRCIAQGSGTLQFQYETAPTSNLTANVVILGV